MEALIVPVFADGRLDGAAKAASTALQDALSGVLTSGEFKGGANETTLLHSATPPKRVLAVGLGERDKFELSSLAKYAGVAVRYLGKRNVHSFAFALPLEAAGDPERAAEFIVEGALAGTIDATTYRTEPDKPIALEEIALLTTADTHEFDKAELEVGAERGRVLGEAVNFARTLALTPANDMTPTHLADAARDVAQRFGLKFHVLDEAQMRDKKMGSILGVSQGSDQPAKMIVLEYAGDSGSSEKLALVGKGITFDSGGISIKPAENMHEMKYDMSGAAGVIAAMGAIAQFKPKANVLGVVPSSENLPGPGAVKPGDILRAMNGKTIEVINTDAEGRLILADALCYARELGATKIVDAATLTGAMVIALGHAATGTISNDDEFRDHFLALAKDTTEKYWPLPLYDEFSTTVKSEIADLRNSAGRPASSLTAAAFLKAFVGDVPWIHLDIAGTAYTDAETPFLAKGPTGYPVRAFVALAEDAAKTDGAARNGAVAATATSATTSAAGAQSAKAAR
ncbi:MAG: leucyl aminopeptidase [Candidatus Eremiobacteraeota bacterium]|nr:leucyl aminopeptidase [Candidatus Eremiobacteraeota bacterium]